MMTSVRPTVVIIDDDPSARRGIARLIQAAGMNTEAYDSALDFLNRKHTSKIGCIVLDVKMAGMDGLQLQEELINADYAPPIIFVSGHSDIPEATAAMKKGAVDFFSKPVDGERLLNAIEESLRKDRENSKKFSEQKKIRERLSSLSPREYTVLKFVIAGRLNKQIAFALSITEDTVKVHRRRVMQKMGAGSLAELVRLCERVDIQPAKADDL
jgi:FixJ family two-component response regulator